MIKNSKAELIKRFERKWLFNGSNIELVKLAIIRSKFLFNEIYSPRAVNSIYFDDCKFSSIIQNLDGVKRKVKYRVRWYGKSDIIQNPQLEIKSKDGYITQKKTINLNLERDIKFNFDGVNLLKKLILKNIMYQKNLVPIASTHYFRHYYLSANKKIRATLDSNLRSSLLYGYTNYYFKRYINNQVLEFKYDNTFDNFVRNNLKNITSRISKNSKYVISAIEKPISFLS